MSFSFLATGLLVFGALGVGLREIDHPGYPYKLDWPEAQFRGLQKYYIEGEAAEIKKIQDAFIEADRKIRNRVGKHKKMPPDASCTNLESVRKSELYANMWREQNNKHVRLAEAHEFIDRVCARKIIKASNEAKAHVGDVKVTLGEQLETQKEGLAQAERQVVLAKEALENAERQVALQKADMAHNKKASAQIEIVEEKIEKMQGQAESFVLR
jgi:hypothetical protein